MYYIFEVCMSSLMKINAHCWCYVPFTTDHHRLNASRIESVRLISDLLIVVINMMSGEI